MGDDWKWWLALLRAPGLGNRGAAKLLRWAAKPADLFGRDLPAGLPGAVQAWLAKPNWAGIDPDLAWLAEPGRTLVTIQDPLYPPLLREIPDPPLMLFVHGDARVLQHPQVAMVGSRNASANARRVAHGFAASLCNAGLVVTSGLASGIDQAAHEGALRSGGITIAVAGTGLDRVYPQRHTELAERISRQGAVISEYPVGTPPVGHNFPRRNRIISGLSVGTLVVEAALRSGSLITARLAAEQGREVFAIPGSIHHPGVRGCHRLIRNGAKLVEEVSDILEELGPLLAVALDTPPVQGADEARQGSAPRRRPAQEQLLLDCVDFEPTGLDELISRSGMGAESVSATLLVLELQGLVSSAAGGGYYRVPAANS